MYHNSVPFGITEMLKNHLDHKQLTALRWISIGIMILFTTIAYILLDISLPYLYLFSIIAFAATLNLLAELAPICGLQQHFSLSAVIHLSLDLFTWGLFLAVTGGATNPLVSFLLPAVAIAAVILPEYQAWSLGLLAIYIYTLLWWFYIPLCIKNEALATHLHLVGMWVTFVILVAIAVWFISRMSSALRTLDQALAAARETELRNNWIVSVGALAAGTAHELSTPLSTLATLVEEQLANPSRDQELNADLQLMHTQVYICKNVLTQLTVKAGQARANGRQTYSAAQWLQELATTWQSLHPFTNITLDLNSTLKNIYVIQDITLDRAICNLVDNAVKANRDCVVVAAQCVNQNLEVCINDNGPGIQALCCGNSMEAKKYKGLGIGLLLAYSAIERYDGTLTVTTGIQGGTQALISLPLDRIKMEATI